MSHFTTMHGIEPCYSNFLIWRPRGCDITCRDPPLSKRIAPPLVGAKLTKKNWANDTAETAGNDTFQTVFVITTNVILGYIQGKTL